MISMGTRHLCGCHKNLRVISKEHQAYLHHMGRDTHGMIAFESLPLLRLYYLWSILSVVSMVCLVVTQALWYVWLVDGAIGMWQACVPVGILCLGGVLYVTLCKSVSASTGVCILLAFSWLVSSLPAVYLFLFCCRDIVLTRHERASRADLLVC